MQKRGKVKSYLTASLLSEIIHANYLECWDSPFTLKHSFSSPGGLEFQETVAMFYEAQVYVFPSLPRKCDNIVLKITIHLFHVSDRLWLCQG